MFNYTDRYRLPGVCLALADGCLFAGSLIVCHQLRCTPLMDWLLSSLELTSYVGVAFSWATIGPVALLVAVLGTMTLERFGVYHQRVGFARKVDAGAYVGGVIVAYIFLAATLFAVKADPSRFSLGIAAVLTATGLIALQPCWERLHCFLVRRGWGFRRVLLAAPADGAEMVLAKLQRFYGSYYQVIGLVVDDQREAAQGGDCAPVVGSIQDLVSAALRLRVKHVLLALPVAEHQRLIGLLNACREAKIEARVVPDLFDALSNRINIGTDIESIPIETLDATPLDGIGRWIKRGMDVVVGGVALLVFAPVMAVLAVLIRLDSPGPAFYVQERVGGDGRVFRMFKLRSMRIDAEDGNKPGWTVPGDERVTRVGQFLRRYNLDELPQLINVIRGEMSLVGPRPERPMYVNEFKRYIPRYMRRHLVKSGMTGLAQVSGLRGDTSIAERTRYDLYYIEHWSLLLDLRILLHTLWAWRNAY